MTRFCFGGDEDGTADGHRSGRPVPKRRRTFGSLMVTASAATASTSNSSYTAADSDAPSAPSQPILSAVDVEVESDKETDTSSDASFSDYEELTSSSEEEEEEWQEQSSRNEGLSSEGILDSTILVSGRNPPTPVSVTLKDPDVLDCPICLDPLSPPVYQCENGHIACSSCCTNMRNKCANCCLPIGYSRCRAIEKVVDSVKMACKNLQHGCNESIQYSKKHDHEKACTYSPCSCPYLGCDYVSISKGIYKHLTDKHLSECKKFILDSVSCLKLERNQKQLFLQESGSNILFVLDRTIKSLGSFICVICIAPTSSKSFFSYEIAVKYGESSIRAKSMAENMPKWIAQPCAKKYFLVPRDFYGSYELLTLELTISCTVK